MKLAAFILVVLAGSFSAASESLNLLSMNVYMLPKPVKWSMQYERTAAIVQQLSESGYDVVMLQEAFQDSFRAELTEKLKVQFPYTHYLNRDSSWMHIFGSGLFILSRHPFTVLSETYFDDCEGFDCFASKGALIVELSISDGSTYQIATTHLQAGPQNGHLRLDQLKKIKAQLNTFHKDGIPQLLVGDLNIDFSDPEFITGLALMQMNYSPLIGLMKTTNARTNDCYSTPEKKLWIDHVWFDKMLETTRPEIEVKDFSFNFEDKKCPSSDHHGVELRHLHKVVAK